MERGPRNELRNIYGVLHVDGALAARAERQHGVVAARQLIALGLTDDQVHYRARTGHLHRIHRGVYAVGHRKLTREGRWMAAVLACAPGAVLSHQTAAAHWDISAAAAKVHITTAAGHSRGAIRVHRTNLHPADMTVKDGIPVTTVDRTIVDLASAQDEDRLTRTIEAAVRERIFNLNQLEAAMQRAPRRGIPRLNKILADYRDPGDIRSPAERDFLTLVRKAGLPEPQTNVLVAGVLVDFVWPQWRLVVEIDSRTYHTSPRQFERDRVRDAILQRHGYRVLRVTRKRLQHEPRAVLDDILAPSRVRQLRG